MALRFVSYQTSGYTVWITEARTMCSRPRRLHEVLDRLLVAVEDRFEENIGEPRPDDPHDPHKAGHDDVRVVERFVRQRPREAFRDVRRERRPRKRHPDQGPDGHRVQLAGERIRISRVRQLERRAYDKQGALEDQQAWQDD